MARIAIINAIARPCAAPSKGAGSTIEAYIDGKQVGPPNDRMIGVDVPRGNTALLQGVTKLGFHVDEDLGLTFDSRGRRLYYHVLPDGSSPAALAITSGAAHANGQGKEAAILKQLESQAVAAGVGCLSIPLSTTSASLNPLAATATES